MNFEELIRKRRSIRKYSAEAVSEETVAKLIGDALLAPSAGNSQPWKFVVVHSKEMIRRISDESRKNILARIHAAPDAYASRYRGMLEKEDFNVFYNAPCLVLILGDSGYKNLQADCSLAAGYLMLSATANGLGSCWVNLGAAIEDAGLLAELGIPAGSTIVAPIALGYPETTPAVPRRNAPEILKVIA